MIRCDNVIIMIVIILTHSLTDIFVLISLLAVSTAQAMTLTHDV